ncbi:LutC/YkgG family protein [Proteiniphilum sp. UBA5480]|uniref:LutC/YkgG family protein n=1 Tax=Proteiniphilum sp. UBA5480 TaxID=1947282 RepID=UPI00257F211B|nr:LUD domain-containing protein [Proteiniphilum sp. UBA5480]
MDRNKILLNIQRSRIKPVNLPEPFCSAEKEGDKTILFKEMLMQTGGDCIEVNSTEELNSLLDNNFRGATDLRRNELFKNFLSYSNKDSLERLKTVILEGQFGVAENGSIWIDDSNFPNRLIPFITEELVLCLDAKQIVRNMHEAYLRTDNAISGFGVFISGPSKTSDIEQHLVYGAHGAKKLIVVISHETNLV